MPDSQFKPGESPTCKTNLEKINNLEKSCVMLSTSLNNMLEKFNNMHDSIDKIQQQISELNRRLFIDNGTPSLTSRLKDLENINKMRELNKGEFNKYKFWFFTTVGGLVISSFVQYTILAQLTKP